MIIIRSIEGLKLRLVEAAVILDRPIPLRNLVTATVRGVAGYLLLEHDPGLVGRWFKPGQDGNQPAACVFQPVLAGSRVAAVCPFRLMTWDPAGELIPALQQAMTRARGRPFGEGRARIERVDWDAVTELRYTGIADPPPVQRIVLRTPLRLKIRGQWVAESTLTAWDLARGLINRINALSAAYGNGIQLVEEGFREEAEACKCIDANLKYVQTARRSSTQRSNIDLSGLVGHLDVRDLPPMLSSLLAVGSIVHLGKHTVEGCGAIRLDAPANSI